MLNYILFDLDGTLTDSGNGIINSLKYALNKMGIKETDESVLKSFIGPPIKERGIEVYGITVKESEDLLAFYREYFVKQGMYENEVYSGVKEMLHTLKNAGKKIIVATSKPEVHACEILRHFGLLQYFDMIVGATLDGKISDKNQVLTEAIKRAKVNVKSAVMIGDRKYDINGGKKFNMITVGVTYGYGDYQELKDAGADYIVDSANQLEKLLMEI